MSCVHREDGLGDDPCLEVSETEEGTHVLSNETKCNLSTPT